MVAFNLEPCCTELLMPSALMAKYRSVYEGGRHCQPFVMLCGTASLSIEARSAEVNAD
tara:strand:+ start:25 stop:198 length:174 start_codon:yes stop_codon:yes gene_type:complete